jgi:hypothetical protein
MKLCGYVFIFWKMEDGRCDECYLTLFMFLSKLQAWLLCYRMILEGKWKRVLETRHLFLVAEFDGYK